jgi:hypothetical protein
MSKEKILIDEKALQVLINEINSQFLKQKDCVTKNNLKQELEKFKISFIRWLVGTNVAVAIAVIFAVKFLIKN